MDITHRISADGMHVDRKHRRSHAGGTFSLLAFAGWATVAVTCLCRAPVLLFSRTSLRVSICLVWLSLIVCAATLQNSAVTKEEWTGCNSPVPAYTFGASDLHVRLWFVVDGVNVGDKASVVWIAPNNSVYRSGSYSPASAPGRWCYGDPLALAGTAAADFAGQWTINVYWNGALLFGTNFNLQGPVSIPPAPTGAWSFSAAIQHQGQPQKWMCGPTTMAMWLGYLNNAGYDPNGLASAIGTTEEGTSLPQFVQGMFDFTRYGYVYSSWGYEDKHAAIKGIMWTIARYNEPVVVVGGNFHWGDNLDLGEPLGWATGLHYLLVRGGRADKNPFQYFSEDNHIRGVWVNDATEDSPRYHGPVSGMRKDTEYPPARLMEYWGLTGAPWYKFWDKRHTSIERDCYACWQRQGGHYTLNDSFLDY